ncbi:MAG: methyltransferase domain-containing protein [Pseudonocardia sp.]|nr:methyltransferase domain-containing protein [Pseudonocardia sp.]
MTPEPALTVPPTSPLRSSRHTFLRAALRSPGQIGAVAPSSPQLAALLASVVPTRGASVVVELGPGTGAISAAIEQRQPPRARHLAVELDEGMASYLRRTRPALEVVQGNALELSTLLAARSVPAVDVVISGLPWSLFDRTTQQDILAEAAGVLAPNAPFVTFAYAHTIVLPPARRFRRLLHEVFDEVVVTRTVWRNLPPAFAYICRRPRVAGGAASPGTDAGG